MKAVVMIEVPDDEPDVTAESCAAVAAGVIRKLMPETAEVFAFAKQESGRYRIVGGRPL